MTGTIRGAACCSLQQIRTKARPVAGIGDDDRGGHISKAFDIGQSLCIIVQIDQRVRRLRRIEDAACHGALNAIRL